MKAFLLVLFALALPAYAQSVHKCTGPDGKRVFQDVPCEGKTEAFKLNSKGALSYVPSGDASGARKAEAERREAEEKEDRRIERVKELSERVIPGFEVAIEQHKLLCQQRLAGGFHKTRTPEEVADLNARCDKKEHELRACLQVRKAECLQLGGCQST